MSDQYSLKINEGQLHHTHLTKALGDRYLSYALSTIISRSLPDVRDGMKPVHRRLLYAMRQLKLDTQLGYKKCARVVGDVIGKYHPHGDQAVYDTMVRLAQDFSLRYPLVEGQGNFGNIDGDNPAAMRYTEARLSFAAKTLMQGLDEDCVTFVPTYDNSEAEPEIMPGCFPNLLANGSTGIAVGMATSIPPHNLSEICNALLALIKNPDLSTLEILNFIQGPDFPTGGQILESRESLLLAYEKGKGSFRVRAKWQVEKLAHGLYQIVVTQLPYQVQKSRLIEKIASLLLSKKLPLLSDVRDESTDEIRFILEPRSRSVTPEHLMEMMFKNTELEKRFSLNINVLDTQQVPRVMGLKDVLQSFLEHRYEMLVRRCEYALKKTLNRLEILEGYLICYLNLDEVINIIRQEDEPKPILMDRFNLTDHQTESILNMRLRSLKKLEEVEMKKEQDFLMKRKENLEKTLSDDKIKWKEISKEIQDLNHKFHKEQKDICLRRTHILHEKQSAVELSEEMLVEREPITVICSQKGWIRLIKGHSTKREDIKYKEGDSEGFVLLAQSTDKLLLVSSSGRSYTISCSRLKGGRGNGEPLSLHIQLDQKDKIVHICLLGDENQKILLISSRGIGFLCSHQAMKAQTSSGKQIMLIPQDHKLTSVLNVQGDHVVLAGKNGKVLIIPIEDIPQMSKGKGVILQKYKKEEKGLSHAFTILKEEGITWVMGGTSKRSTTLKDLTPWIGRRGDRGNQYPRGFPFSRG